MLVLREELVLICIDSIVTISTSIWSCTYWDLWKIKLYYTILYYTILYYTILYYAMLCYAMLCYAMLCYTILYYTILYYTILYYTILYYTILYYTTILLDVRYGSYEEEINAVFSGGRRMSIHALKLCARSIDFEWQKYTMWFSPQTDIQSVKSYAETNILTRTVELERRECTRCGSWQEARNCWY